MEFENKVIDESMQGTAIELQNQGGEGKKNCTWKVMVVR